MGPKIFAAIFWLVICVGIGVAIGGVGIVIGLIVGAFIAWGAFLPDKKSKDGKGSKRSIQFTCGNAATTIIIPLQMNWQ